MAAEHRTSCVANLANSATTTNSPLRGLRRICRTESRRGGQTEDSLHQASTCWAVRAIQYRGSDTVLNRIPHDGLKALHNAVLVERFGVGTGDPLRRYPFRIRSGALVSQQ